MSCFLGRQKPFRKAPTVLRTLGKYVDLTQLLPFMHIFCQAFCRFYLGYIMKDLSFPEQIIIQKQGHSCQMPKPCIPEQNQVVSNLTHLQLSSPLSIRTFVISRRAVIIHKQDDIVHSYHPARLYYPQINEKFVVLCHIGTETNDEISTFCGKQQVWMMQLPASPFEPNLSNQVQCSAEFMLPFKLEQRCMQFVIKGPTTLSQHGRYRLLQNRHGCSIPPHLQTV